MNEDESYLQQTARKMYVVIRSNLPPLSLLPEVRSHLKQLDSDLPLSGVSSMQHVVWGSLSNSRLQSSVPNKSVLIFCSNSGTFHNSILYAL